eukprot:36054_1
MNKQQNRHKNESFERTDMALAQYYDNCGRDDSNGTGKFIKFVVGNTIDENQIDLWLENDIVDNCLLVYMDDQFPLNFNKTNYSRNTQIFNTIKHCLKYGTPPSPKDLYALKQPSNRSINDFKQNVSNVDEKITQIRGSFVQTDIALGKYYFDCGRYDYYNSEGIGKFRNFTKTNHINEKQIGLLFEEHFDKSLLVHMDKKFPLVAVDINQANYSRNYQIFEVIKCCYQNGIPPTRQKLPGEASLSDTMIPNIPLHLFNVRQLCHKIQQWVTTDIKYKNDLSKMTNIFQNCHPSKLASLETKEVKAEMVKFMTLETFMILNEYFIIFSQGNDMKLYNAEFIAHIMHTYPLIALLSTFKKQQIDGKKIIDMIANDQKNNLIQNMTGWNGTEVQQIELMLMKNYSTTKKQFIYHMNRVFNDKEYTSISNKIINRIRTFLLKQDIDQLSFKIKKNENTNDFNEMLADEIQNLLSDCKSDAITLNRIYTLVAQCFSSNYSYFQSCQPPDWNCYNCRNYNFINTVGNEKNYQLTRCSLCGVTQMQSIKLQIKDYDTCSMGNEIANQQQEVKDEIDNMIDDAVKAKHIKLMCPNNIDKSECSSMRRLAKKLIKYNKWLNGNGVVDFSSIGNDTFRKVFIDSVKLVKSKLEFNDELLLNAFHDNTENIADIKTFQKKSRKQFANCLTKNGG